MGQAEIIFIAGPTASGKSATALQLGEALGGEIVNADAMQIYDGLRIVTARPSASDEARVPHHLYGVLDGAKACSAGRWAQLAMDCINDIRERGKPVILVGGTGLYFTTLLEGLSPIPEIPAPVRAAARARWEALGASAFKDEVIDRDPAMARLPVGDTQRLMRAWEVFEGTGTPLSVFQQTPRKPLVTEPVTKLTVLPKRSDLYAACDKRATQMASSGAIDEVRSLMERNLDPLLPVMKALGVPEIISLLRGERDQAEAIELLQRNTRRFAKRQMTWLRHQMVDWPCYENTKMAFAAVAGDR